MLHPPLSRTNIVKIRNRKQSAIKLFYALHNILYIDLLKKYDDNYKLFPSKKLVEN